MPEPGVDQTVVKNTNEARQGVTGQGVRYVLAASLGAVVLMFGVVYVYFVH